MTYLLRIATDTAVVMEPERYPEDDLFGWYDHAPEDDVMPCGCCAGSCYCDDSTATEPVASAVRASLDTPTTWGES